MCTFVCQLKARAEMERDIPRNLRGWWYDICPGQALELRHATISDLQRVFLHPDASRNPNDYMCETGYNGALVSKAAIKYAQVKIEDLDKLRKVG